MCKEIIDNDLKTLINEGLELELHWFLHKLISIVEEAKNPLLQSEHKSRGFIEGLDYSILTLKVSLTDGLLIISL